MGRGGRGHTAGFFLYSLMHDLVALNPTELAVHTSMSLLSWRRVLHTCGAGVSHRKGSADVHARPHFCSPRP